MIRRLLDLLGSARSVNADLNANALRISSLEAANTKLTEQLRQSNVRAMVWQVKAEDLQDKLTVADRKIIDLTDELDYTMPLVAYARKRKASLAAYEAKRGRGNG